MSWSIWPILSEYTKSFLTPDRSGMARTFCPSGLTDHCIHQRFGFVGLACGEVCMQWLAVFMAQEVIFSIQVTFALAKGVAVRPVLILFFPSPDAHL